MNKIRHFVITRFMSVNFKKNEVLFDSTFLNSAFEMLKRHLLSSLSMQTNKNFELIITIHNDVEIDKVQFLYDLQQYYDFKITILRYGELTPYIEKCRNGYDFIITSRIDYDDHIYKTVVADTQLKVDSKYTAQLYGLNNGVSIVDGENEAHFMHMDYNKSGFFSCFETLILNNRKIGKIFNIYDLGNHTVVCKTLKNNHIKYGIKQTSDIKIEWDLCKDIRYIWIRHKNAASIGSTCHCTDKIINDLQFSDFGYNRIII